MKASLQFRDEQSPLLRMKFPVTLAGMHLLSGIVLGDAQDLALQIGTHAESCPSLKFSYHPNNPLSPFNVVFKFGLGPWGPTNAAAVSVSAHLRFSKASSSTFFSIHVKPRFGDFGLRKMAKLSCFKTMGADYRCEPAESAVNVNDHIGICNGRGCKAMTINNRDGFDDASAVTPIKLDKNTMFTPILQRYPHRCNKIETSGTESWIPDSVTLNNIFRCDRNSILGHVSEPDSTSLGGASVMNERNIDVACNNVDAGHTLEDLGSHDSRGGWSFHAYSMMSLAKQATVRIRWVVKMYPDVMQGWDDKFCTVNLPYLCLQKISITTSKYTMETQDQAFLSEHGTLSQGHDTCQLSPVSALCSSMDGQLQLLHAENRILKKTIKDMRAQFEQQGSRNSAWYAGKLCGSVNANDKLKGSAKDGRGIALKDDHSNDGDGLDAPKKFSVFGLMGRRNSISSQP